MDISKIVNAKSIKELEDLENEMRAEIDKELKDENEIIHAIQDIASSLIVYEKASAEINGRKYFIKFKVVRTGQTIKTAKGNEIAHCQIILMASDVLKATLAPKQYLPCIVRVDYNYELTEKGNITAAVEGWVRHITDTVKPEMLED
jgi:hypothetical protein